MDEPDRNETAQEGGDAPTAAPRRLRRVGRRTLVVSLVALGVAAGGGAIAAAAGGHGGGSGPRGYGAPGAEGGAPGGPPGAGGPLGRAIHGTFVVPSASGATTTYATDVQQAGTVTALSATSITLASPDGYTRTYVIDASTKKASSVAQGGQAVVVATGDPATALSVVVPGDRPGRGGGPGATPPSGGPSWRPTGAPGGPPA